MPYEEPRISPATTQPLTPREREALASLRANPAYKAAFDEGLERTLANPSALQSAATPGWGESFGDAARARAAGGGNLKGDDYNAALLGRSEGAEEALRRVASGEVAPPRYGPLPEGDAPPPMDPEEQALSEGAL